VVLGGYIEPLDADFYENVEQVTQVQQNEWHGNWVYQMSRIAKAGGNIFIGAQDWEKQRDDQWGGVSELFAGRRHTKSMSLRC
jgi:hypothetical protein